jgi:glycosyltransferase involved in cell wall biosynthesis
MHISVVSPVYKAPKILPELVARLEKSLSDISNSFEVILVDDGCPWDSWSVIEDLSNDFKFIKGIKLSRNFGQHYAITAGLDHAKGDWVVVMDCDLQDKPEEIQKLYDESQKNFDIVLAARENRKDNPLKKLFSKFFYRSLSCLSGAKYDHRVANFGIYSKKVITAINQFREPIRYFPGLVQYVGFKSTTININHASREEGQTSYSLKRLFKLALDVILAYSDKPLRTIIKLGLLISLISFAYVAFSIWQWYNDMIVVPGYTSLIASVWFLSGVLISTLGVIGLYLGKTFEAAKGRPIYIVSQGINLP